MNPGNTEILDLETTLGKGVFASKNHVSEPPVTRCLPGKAGAVASKVTHEAQMLHQSVPEGAMEREYRDVPPPSRARKNNGSFKPSRNNIKVSEPVPVGPAPLSPTGEIGNVSSPALAVTCIHRGTNHVLVLSKNKKPLMPCNPARAKELLGKGKAVVHRLFRFVIRLTKRTKGETQPLILKKDPGSKTTGITIVTTRGKILFAAELNHRGLYISELLTSRRQARRGRRYRHNWHRQPKFPKGRSKNYETSRPKGWLPPSLMHRVYTVITWAKRLCKWAPLTEIWVECNRFDMQLIRNPNISGVLYQQGTLFGYEVREYLLEKWGRKCTYCDKENVSLEIEHIHPRDKGGVNSIGNLTIACRPCNKAKDNRLLEDFLAHDPERAKRIREQMSKPLKDAAAINATRYRLTDELRSLNLPVRCFTGGRTKYNRCRLGLPKTHWLDAAALGKQISSTTQT